MHNILLYTFSGLNNNIIIKLQDARLVDYDFVAYLTYNMYTPQTSWKTFIDVSLQGYNVYLIQVI